MIENLMASKWALEPTFHDRMVNIALRRMTEGKSPFVIDESQRATPYVVSIEQKAQASNLEASQPAPGYGRLTTALTKSGLVVVVPIKGTMTRYGDLCSWGTEDIANWILEANADASVSAIVLEINSPGGEVDGTQYLGDVIKYSQKPVVAWVAGMAASAGYWVASQAREIMLESETTSDVGSIGVLAMHVDASAYYEKEGFKVQIIRSEGSEDKALFNSVEPLSDAAMGDIKQSLKVVRDTFIKTVKAGRPNIADDVFSGKMYDGKTAKSKGMVDRFGYLGDAIQRADILARKQ